MGFLLLFTTPEHLVILTALLGWAGFLFGGFAFGRLDPQRERRMPAWTRMASSGCLVVCAWTLAGSTIDSPLAFYSILIATGMTLGFLGDLFLAGWLRILPPIVGGMVAFGLGHASYVLALWWLTAQKGFLEPLPAAASYSIWGVICLCCWYIVLLRQRSLSPMRLAALLYGMLLAGLAGTATLLVLGNRAFIPLLAGCVLFLLSDLLVAMRRLNRVRWYLIDDIIWLTYGPAQALIVTSICMAIPAFSPRLP